MRTLLTALVVASVACLAAAEPAASQPAPAGRVTIKGIMLSTWHFYKHELPARNQSPKGTKDKFDLVMYAFDGPADVQNTLQEVLAMFPKEGVDADAALAIQEQFDRRLMYYIHTGDQKETDKLTYDYTWVPTAASVTGTLQDKDGKRWLTEAKVKTESYKAKISSQDSPSELTFKYPPDCMLRPDKPLVMPTEKPFDLAVANGLSLKCVPIPPGRFIMGSPMYQCPRYQDEAPIDVTLSKTFYFSEIPVTQEMFDAVMGKEANRSKDKGPQLAVENTPFPDIREFCRQLSLKNKCMVRVPTAAEMEYVARLGNSSPCFPAKYFPQRTNVGTLKNPGPVKTKAPNAWGVYDLPASAVTAVSDWKAPNRPGKVTDPQGEPFDSPWVYYDSAIRSAQQQDRPVSGMILKPPYMYPAVHKGTSGLDWDRPNMHDRYGEDGLDGGNGKAWKGIFRLVVEGPPAATATSGATSKPAR